MSGAGFGAFMQGLQGGISFGQDVRKNRQREKLYDDLINKSLDEKKSRKLSTEAADALAGDGQTTSLSDYELPDPILYDLGDMIRSKAKSLFSPKKKALPVDDPQEMPEIDPSEAPMSGEQFASAANDLTSASGFGLAPDDLQSVGGLRAGGSVEDALARKVAQEAAIAGEVAARRGGRAIAGAANTVGRHATGEVLEPGWRRALTGIRGSGDLGRLSQGGKMATGKALGALGALGATALDAGGTPTEDYVTRFGGNPDTYEPSFLKDVGVRTLGAASDLGGQALDLAAGVTGLPIGTEDLYRDKQGKKQAALPVEKPTETKPRDTTRPAPGSGGYRGRSSSSKRVALPDTPEEAAKAPDPLAGVDISKMRAEDLPNFSATDWTKFRAASVRALTLRGVPIGEAMDTVDQQVIGMQIRGMSNFANQAMIRMVNGDLEGAQPFIRAAFQYVPSTTDVKTVVHNGHIIAMGYDEDTGEPVGQPFVVNPETLSAVLKQFSAPGAFAEWAQDRRDFRLREQEAQARADFMANQNEIGMTRASADLLGEIVGGGASAPKPGDIERPTGTFAEATQMIIDDLGIEDADAPQVIAAVMGMMYRRALQEGRTISAPEIAEAARRNVQSRGLDYMRQLLTGQQ